MEVVLLVTGYQRGEKQNAVLLGDGTGYLYAATQCAAALAAEGSIALIDEWRPQYERQQGSVARPWTAGRISTPVSRDACSGA